MEAEEGRGNLGESLHAILTGRNGKVGRTGLGLASLNAFYGLCGIGTAPSGLRPGPSMIRAVSHWLG